MKAPSDEGSSRSGGGIWADRVVRPYGSYFGAMGNSEKRADEGIGPYKPLSGAARQLPQGEPFGAALPIRSP